MRRLTSIVAVNLDGVIGAGNALPWRIKSDLKFFKSQTLGHIVILGRKTFDSLDRRPLPGRLNVVVSHSFQLVTPESGCVGATGIAEALAKAEAAPKAYKEIFVIGGQSMYEQFAPFVDRYLITVVHKAVPSGDTFFDEGLIGDMSGWVKKDLFVGDANNAGDEAQYEIFELSRKNGDPVRAERLALLSSVGRERPSSQVRRYARNAGSAADLPAPALQF